MTIGGSEKSWNGIAFTALVLLAGITIYDVAFPKPIPPSRHQQETARLTLMRSIEIDKKDLAATQKQVSRYVWTVPNLDQIGASSLTTLTTLAQKHKVSLLGFRPQKMNIDGGLEELPYLIILEGPYLGVSAFLNDLENPQTKLAVNMVQVASADANTDRVNANIGVTAYTLAPAGASSSKPGGTKKVASPKALLPTRTASPKVTTHATKK